MVRPLCSAVALLVLLCSTLSHADEDLRLPGIKGTDDRVTVTPDRLPWTAIGRLNSRVGGHCTATVIGANTVLTAAHCLWNKRTRRYLAPQSLHFVAGWHKGAYLFDSKAAALFPSPDFDPTKRTISNAVHDWAIVTLAKDPVPTTGLIKATRPTAGAVNELIQAGYSQDRRHVLTVNPQCEGTLHPKGLILHDCDAVKGDSGSPLMVKVESDVHIVGIHVATTRSTGLAAIPQLTRFIKSPTDSVTEPSQSQD